MMLDRQTSHSDLSTYVAGAAAVAAVLLPLFAGSARVVGVEGAGVEGAEGV